MISETNTETIPPKAGIVFICTGRFFTRRAFEAAQSVRKSNPSLPMVLFTDQEILSDLFTAIEKIEDPHIRSKIDYLHLSPFERTLYLDTDTRVIDDISELFQLLDKFEMAGAHIRARGKKHRLRGIQFELPRAFPQINCGVLLYRKCDKTAKFFEAWRTTYREAKIKGDQWAFRELLWSSEIKFYVLAPEYNMRHPSFCRWFTKEPRPKVLHKRRYHYGMWVKAREFLASGFRRNYQDKAKVLHQAPKTLPSLFGDRSSSGKARGHQKDIPL